MNTIPPVNHPGGTADTLILSPGEIRGITNIAMTLATARQRFVTRPHDPATLTALADALAAARQINERHRAALILDPETLETIAAQIAFRKAI